jgi:hypothetical protein
MIAVVIVLAVASLIGLALRGRRSNATRTTRTREPLAIVLLLVGVLAFGVGWFIGVVLLWSSPAWRARDKLLGTLVWPFGLPYAVLVALFAADPIFGGKSPNGLQAVAYLIVAALWVLAPIYTAIHLTRRLIQFRKRSAAPAGGPFAIGWFADPAGRFDVRWYDGTRWTDHVGRADADGQTQHLTDPL